MLFRRFAYARFQTTFEEKWMDGQWKYFFYFSAYNASLGKKTIGVVVFSLAKAIQYTGLGILGVEGYKKLKDRILKRNTSFRMPAKRSKRPHNKHRLKRMRKANRKTDAPISQTKA